MIVNILFFISFFMIIRVTVILEDFYNHFISKQF